MTTIERVVYGLGEDSGSRPEMGEGWREPTPIDTWTRGPASTLVIPAPACAVDHFMVLRLLIRPDMPEQRVRLAVHGEEVAQFTVFDRVMRAARIPAALLQRGPALPVTLQVEDEGVALGSLALQPDLDAPPAPPTDTDLSDRATMLRFESLGENCELGLVQRAAGAEPLGLMRFASTNLQRLLLALDEGFAGLGAADKLVVEVSENGREYMVTDQVYGLHYHAWVKTEEMTAADVHRREVRRVPFLIRRLTEDLQTGHKIFVRKERGGEPDSIVYPLLPALRRWGPNTLLYVKLADADHPPGSVERREPGFLIGYIARFAPGENAHDFLTDQWLTICRTAQALVWPELAPASAMLAGQPGRPDIGTAQTVTAPSERSADAGEPAAVRAPRTRDPRPSARVALANRLAFRLQNGTFEAASGPERSFSSLLQLETPPFWARLIFFSDQHEPYRLDGAAIAATGAPNDGVTPVDTRGAADAAAWRQVTFNGKDPDSEPLDTPDDGVGSLIIPACNGTPAEPMRVMSDWVPLPGTGRVDGGRGALLLVRSYAADMQRYASFDGLADAATGCLHTGYWAHGDATRPGWNAQWHRFDRLSACYGLQYISAVPGATVVGIGDGVMQGLGSSGKVSGFGVRACAAISRPDLPVSWFNEGRDRRTSAESARAGLWAIKTLRPQVTLIQTWSVHDPATQDSAEQSLARAIALAEATRRFGGIPILVTGAPALAADNDGAAAYRWVLEQVRGLMDRDTLVLDLDAIWSSGTSPTAYRPEFDSGDHQHPNDHGHTAAAAVLAALLQPMLGAA